MIAITREVWKIPVLVYVEKKKKGKRRKKVKVVSIVMEKNGRIIKDLPALKRLRRVYG